MNGGQQRPPGPNRLAAAYFAAAVLGAGVIAGVVFLLASNGDDEQPTTPTGSGGAHVQPQSGTTNGVPLDGREGTPPPEATDAELEEAAESAGCELQTDLPEEGREHLSGSDSPRYRTSPPTSGDHALDPQADGAYRQPPDQTSVVHSLEHGRVAFQYVPQLQPAQQLEIKGSFDSDPDGIVLMPNADMPSEVAATAWRQLMGCPSYSGAATLSALEAFRDRYRGEGPEAVPISL